jgi:hypothetical protein
MIDIDENEEDVRLHELFQQFDDKLRRDLDNRMVSYFNTTHNVFIYVGNYWMERPVNAHKDIQEAKNHVVRVKQLILPSAMGNEDVIQLKFRERAKGEHSDALING